MNGVNKVILVGTLGKDPEVNKTPSGKIVASFSIATSEKWTDSNNQRKESTEWHNVVLWDKLADLAGQYLKKGSSVYLEGKIKTRSWNDKQGQKRYKTEIEGKVLNFLNTKKSVDEAPTFNTPQPMIPQPMAQTVQEDSDLPF